MTPQPPALLTPSTVVFVLALLMVNLVGFVVARSLVESTRSRREDADAVSDTSTPDSAAGSGVETVDCPNCEAENEPGYRYCRDCVSELPGSSAPDSGAVPSFGRFVR